MGNSQLSLNLEIAADGFVKIFVANESNIDIWFDDIEINYTPARIVQENHYYPFGLNMAGIEKQGIPDNKFQYNQGTGKKQFKTERDRDFGLNWDMTKHRTYDYQLGRFNQIDPLAEATPQESLSPYQYSFNNPVRYNDPYGDCPDCPWFSDDGARVNYELRKLGNYIKSKFQHDALDGNGHKIPVGAVAYSTYEKDDNPNGKGWRSKDFTDGPTEIYDDVDNVTIGSSGNSVVSFSQNLRHGLNGVVSFFELEDAVNAVSAFLGVEDKPSNNTTTTIQTSDTQNKPQALNPDDYPSESEKPLPNANETGEQGNSSSINLNPQGTIKERRVYAPDNKTKIYSDTVKTDNND
ncbi:RHS repeat domain-containing protein [Chondrinema litorale]|uniref:RHS repeat domain-containing protein n=1 Tax=Chondrinema litorale TaxID=2994555 RepID=UPI0025436210|nr:RHS repeat-associated core domain-containing protein [Chondrinema litorale]UZR99856.1 hypothetical protein OQ292_38365 [Chondrinema litorale]